MVFCFCLGAEEEYPLQVPENSISFNGTNATFTCLSTLRNCDSMKWYQFSSNDWSQIHFDIHPNITNKFIMENSTLGCKLTVRNVQVSDQKDFKCVFKDSAERTAGLYVIGKLLIIFRLFCYVPPPLKKFRRPRLECLRGLRVAAGRRMTRMGIWCAKDQDSNPQL